MKNKDLALAAFGHIRPLVDAFLKEMGEDLNATRMGKEVLQDPNFVFMLRLGREVRIGTAEKVVDYVERKRPGFTRQFCLDRVQAL